MPIDTRAVRHITGRIRRWRDTDNSPDDGNLIEMLCEAEEVLTAQQAQIATWVALARAALDAVDQHERERTAHGLPCHWPFDTLRGKLRKALEGETTARVS